MDAQHTPFDYSEVPHDADTDATGRNRFQRRVDNIFARHRDRIEGRSVLDLACNTGRLAYPLLMLGASQVTGVEARPELIERGTELFDDTPYADRMTFHQDDLFDFLDRAEPGSFDVIVCAGFLYHTVRHADFFRAMKRLRPETLFIDTNVAKNYFWFGRQQFGKPPALFVTREDPTKTSDTIDPDGIVYWPSTSFLETMMEGAGYTAERVNFKQDGSSDWSGMKDYRKGTRAAYVGRLTPTT